MAAVRVALCIVAAVVAARGSTTRDPGRQWLAGDPHVHSRWTVEYDESKDPPAPLYDDAIYPMARIAQMARAFGLRWVVVTDHGGIDHAAMNREKAYPDLQRSREEVPDLLQFLGLELNMPGMDHHTLIVPHGTDEAAVLFEIEKRFDALERWPRESARNTEQARLAALAYMEALPAPPLVFANHPGRGARGPSRWGRTDPRTLRQNMDLAPTVYRGMEGAPGHQARALAPDQAVKGAGTRGSYGRRSPTLGGFDQMTAVVGGVWDALLGEGRRFWITAGSDLHIHHSETVLKGRDFWPGEFHKTYVLAAPSYEDVFNGLREGRFFVTAGDLVTAVDVTAAAEGRQATMGGSLQVAAGSAVEVVIRFRVPDAGTRPPGASGLKRVDLIVGDVQRGRPASGDRNQSARVIGRYEASAWSARDGEFQIQTTIPSAKNMYLRIRGTSTSDPEPVADDGGENPWTDLWFYSNPIFVEVR